MAKLSVCKCDIFLPFDLDNHVLTVKSDKISCFVSASSHRQAAQAIGALVTISSIMAKAKMAKVKMAKAEMAKAKMGKAKMAEAEMAEAKMAEAEMAKAEMAKAK